MKQAKIVLARKARAELKRIVADGNTAQKLVKRARIVLLMAAGVGVMSIMREVGVSKPTVRRWRDYFAEAGVAGLIKGRSKPPGKKPIARDLKLRIVEKTVKERPANATHWSVRTMAEAVGISHTSVQRIWKEYGLKPHLVRTFKVSKDPDFASKVRDITGLYLDPPDKALVLSVDEKSQIQALDRTQPGLPMKKGRAGTMTHDYKRNGTTTLFAALNVLEGKVIGRCMPRHRHQEFIRFLNAIDAEVPGKRAIHVVLDNYATHKHPEVLAWLARHKRFTFHFTPTSCSWLNAVEGYFAKLSRRRLRRGVFKSVTDLQAAINRFVAETNENPKPFLWTKNPDKIIAAVKRGHQMLDSIH